jgi:preprotein translocase subunit SecG
MPMIYRNLIGQNHCSSGLIGMSDAGSGKQVKESKSSERKNTQMSLIFHLIFLCSVLLFYSCNNHEKYDFESSDEALNEYDNLYKTVRSQETCNAEQLASFINLWYECSDTVYKFIQKDPSFTAHAGLTMRFDSITDSIRTRLMELADNFTLSDVAYVKLHTSIYGQDKELDS